MAAEPLRVAQVVGKMNRGGVEAMVMNYYRAMDRRKVQFDFFVDEDSSFPQRAELEQMGARMFLLPPYKQMHRWLPALTGYLRQNRYRVVHCHLNTMNVFPLFAAWCARVPVRICHNHSTAHRGEGKKTVMKYLLRPFDTLFATDCYACSKEAGQWMFGRRRMEKNAVTVVPNAICCERFCYSDTKRTECRGALGIAPDRFVLGHVGRLAYTKNHAFLLQVFERLLDRRPDALLLLVGEGELRPEIERKVTEMGLADRVIFAGAHADVAPFYCAMDAICVPSLYEGFLLAALEAQACQLPGVYSTAASQEAMVSPLAVRMSLSESPASWAEALLRQAEAYSVRSGEAGNLAVRQAGFEIGDCARRLCEEYLRKAEAAQ